MAKVIPGRFTAEMPDSFVVFRIGFRINNFFAVSKWLPVMRAMGPMISELYKHPELGFLGTEVSVTLRGVHQIQYWRSFDDLERYARGGIHLEAWKNFNRAVGNDGTVGIYHETFLVDAGKNESVYANMPVSGLAKATKHVPVKGKTDSARARLSEHKEPPAPVT